MQARHVGGRAQGSDVLSRAPVAAAARGADFPNWRLAEDADSTNRASRRASQRGAQGFARDLLPGQGQVQRVRRRAPGRAPGGDRRARDRDEAGHALGFLVPHHRAALGARFERRAVVRRRQGRRRQRRVRHQGLLQRGQGAEQVQGGRVQLVVRRAPRVGRGRVRAGARRRGRETGGVSRRARARRRRGAGRDGLARGERGRVRVGSGRDEDVGAVQQGATRREPVPVHASVRSRRRRRDGDPRRRRPRSRGGSVCGVLRRARVPRVRGDLGAARAERSGGEGRRAQDVCEHGGGGARTGGCRGVSSSCCIVHELPCSVIFSSQ
mmetsp:Transcript_12899/g.55419  ORF Transcript_12899/g.55419 Transcript_12899/m.55419 type:complete len:325 (-) Transcript_12899:23-997(-)